MLDIEKQFPGVKALDHAKLQLRPGSIHALMGENGAGKSTLMKCLFGIYKKDAGSIRMNGKEINFTTRATPSITASPWCIRNSIRCSTAASWKICGWAGSH